MTPKLQHLHETGSKSKPSCPCEGAEAIRHLSRRTCARDEASEKTAVFERLHRVLFDSSLRPVAALCLGSFLGDHSRMEEDSPNRSWALGAETRWTQVLDGSAGAPLRFAPRN